MLNRRDFARLATITAAAAALPAAAPRRAILKPKRLAPGDTLALVLPASAAPDTDAVAFARDQLVALGFQVAIGKHAYERFGYFAGPDRDRADDLNAAFADDRIAGVVCYTGGWGSPRVLPLLDYDLIARKPKVLIGYSDITALLNAVHQRTGLVTFHGPVGSSTFDAYTIDNFRRVLMNAEPAGTLAMPPRKPSDLVDRVNRIVRFAGGKASGRLAGGNLTMIASLMGTPHEIDTNGAILFLEDTHEEPYRIDRMLTQLALGGKLSAMAGFIWGHCTDCDAKGNSFSLEEILRDRVASLGVPAISGLPFGHIESKLTLPIGISATLDADAGTLHLDEPAVA